MKGYRSSEWLEFREAILEADGYKCARCPRTRASGAILQVHHKEYIHGRCPWEYPPNLCETLCKKCHAIEHEKLRPDAGWECVADEDFGDLLGECEVCSTQLRYVYLLMHPRWPPIEVGCDCADRLCGANLAKNHHSRLANFMNSKRWEKRSSSVFIKRRSIEIEIMATERGQKISANGIQGKEVFPTLESAQKYVFDIIDNGTLQQFLKKQHRP